MTTLDDVFYTRLRAKYEKNQNGKKEWEEEEQSIRGLLEVLVEELEPRYVIESPINIGGTAIVIRIQDTNLHIPRALKLPRPLEGKEIHLRKIIESEIARLIECTNPNIVSIFDKGEVSFQGKVWPFYVMEYLKDSCDAKDWIVANKPDIKVLINFLKQTAEGLYFLHSTGIVHCDIKLENILVLPNGQAKISDLGSARLLAPSDTSQTLLTCTRDFAHPKLREMLIQTTHGDVNRASGPIPRSVLLPVFDLYSLGLNIFRIVDSYDLSEYALLPPYERKYLSLMACRMLDGRVPAEFAKRAGLPITVFDEIKYKTSADVLWDLKKVTGEYNLCIAIPELDHHFPRTIQASLPNSASLTDRVAHFLASPYMRRLGGITQLGLISQIYPTATHTRLEHTLGCFSNVARYVDALWHDAVNPFFRQVFSEHDINTVLLAALCHDIGHYPLAHDLEEAHKDLFSHTLMGKRIIMDDSDEDSIDLRRLMKEEWQVDALEVLSLLNARPTEFAKPLKQRFLNSLIDGPLDADKLDYLVRDSLNLNLPYGRCIDIERLLKCLTVAFKQHGTTTFIALGVHEKGKVPAEALAFARYALFGSVYWHHTSRSVKAMLHRAVWETIPDSDKRHKEYKDFSEALWTEIIQEGRVGDRQTPSGYLFVQDIHSTPPAETAQISVSDYEILCWIHSRSNERGKQLINMISKRQLFKRLLVVSARKNQNLWERLVHMRKDANPSTMIDFENTFQKELIHAINKLDPTKRISTVFLGQDITDQIVARDESNEVLFLVDIPGDRRSSTTELCLLPEHRIYGPVTSQQDDGEIEDSPVWNSLSTQFSESLGKIRVFCAPDLVATFTEGLSRDQIEGALASAVESVRV